MFILRQKMGNLEAKYSIFSWFSQCILWCTWHVFNWSFSALNLAVLEIELEFALELVVELDIELVVELVNQLIIVASPPPLKLFLWFGQFYLLNDAHIRHTSGTHQAHIRHMSGTCQAHVRHMSGIRFYGSSAGHLRKDLKNWEKYILNPTFILLR